MLALLSLDPSFLVVNPIFFLSSNLVFRQAYPAQRIEPHCSWQRKSCRTVSAAGHEVFFMVMIIRDQDPGIRSLSHQNVNMMKNVLVLTGGVTNASRSAHLSF